MQWLANLAAVMVRPRRTMRRILDAPRDRMIVPLVLLATVSGLIGDVSIREIQENYGNLDPRMRIILPAAFVGLLILFPLLFYVFGWVAHFIARSLDGTATIKAVRSALAWGMAPAVWALLYRIPAMWINQPAQLKMDKTGGTQLSFDFSRLDSGCGLALLFGLLDLAVTIWWLVASSRTLAEAEGFSAARGFGTLVLCLVAPMVVMIAAFLALN